ncbi:winged helix-turn-helix domain-containing protein [Desmospora profundinema]|uniref:OmpR/PhoB-type domain-containing protein n=1 Tax=Desmospora profundinema TaxID=1571184 RepID=A0ABU1IPF0_9BACL|nr:helix-turn-helix domain-containing protein [Desmospora profundinema]MDR6226596.1 hypothetical protein [Desmospora profundinema]
MYVCLFSVNKMLINNLSEQLKSKEISLLLFPDIRRINELSDDPYCLAMVVDLNNADDSKYNQFMGIKNKIPILFVPCYKQRPLKSPSLMESLVDVIVSNQVTHSNDSNHLIHLSSNVFLDVYGHCIRRNTFNTLLSTNEFKLLYLMARNPGQAFSSHKLIDHLNLPSLSSLYVYIRRIRMKIEDNPKKPKILLCRRGEGYFINT